MRTLRNLTVGALLALVPLSADAQNRRVENSRPGWLGVNYDMTVERRSGTTTETLTILDVVDGSPAALAGLKKGDRIIGIDGAPLSGGGFERIARSLNAGDEVRLRISSGGQERNVTITAAERPAEYGRLIMPGQRIRISSDSIRNRVRVYMDSARGSMGSIFRYGGPGDSTVFQLFRDSLMAFPFDTMFGPVRIFMNRLGDGNQFWVGPEAHDGLLPRLEVFSAFNGIAGAEFEPINEGLGQYFGTDHGLLVLKVAPETQADRAGLQAGDVVVRAGDRRINEFADLRTAVSRASGPTTLEVMRKGRTIQLQLELRRR